MSKGLEALKNIKREAGTPYFSTLYDIDMWREDFAIVEKELKALEIIKREPSAVIKVIDIYDTWEEYADDFDEDIRWIESKEEFELVKEVLECKY